MLFGLLTLYFMTSTVYVTWDIDFLVCVSNMLNK